jgi:hypothetical protein
VIYDENDARVQGGAGTADALVIGANESLVDLTLVQDSTFSGFEIIDLSTAGNQSVKLSEADVFALTRGTATITLPALTAGQSFTLGGLTYSSTGNTTAAQLAQAFGNLSHGATTGAGTATGSYTGTFTGFNTGLSNGSGLTLQGATPTDSVGAIAPTFGAGQGMVVSTRQGTLTQAESTTITFADLAAGQTVNVGGVTYTAPAGGATAAQVATAFANIAAGSASADTVNATGTLTGLGSGVAQGNQVVFTSPSVGDVADLSVAASATPIAQVSVSEQNALVIQGRSNDGVRLVGVCLSIGLLRKNGSFNLFKRTTSLTLDCHF